MMLAHPYLFRPAPSFQKIEALDNNERRRYYADPAWRKVAWHEIETCLVPRLSWDRISVAETAVHHALVGIDLATLARQRAQTPFDVYCELSLAEDLHTRFVAHVSNYDPADVAALITQPGVIVGQSDAGAHVAQLCDATTPTDLLSMWVRDRGVLSLERAVHMLTGQLASIFGLPERGRIAPGLAADIVVFDADRVTAGPVRRVRDLPGNEERLIADQPEGYLHLLVNGTPILRDGEPINPEARPGQVLRPA
jgi:N-acyl-D-aspartate/D-glutamate deacylase